MKAITFRLNYHGNINIMRGLLVFLSLLIIFSIATEARAYVIDGFGGDCANEIGLARADNWDQDNLTCTLGADLSDSIQIVFSGITLNGNDKILTGQGFGSGVSIQGRSIIGGVEVRNLTVQDFIIGIQLNDPSDCLIYNNNFINNGTHAVIFQSYESDMYIASHFYLDPDAGGNYWDDHDTIEEGCSPTGGICTTRYVVSIYDISGSKVGEAYDEFPWAKPDGWKTTTVALDIKPGSCTNPINVNSKGVIPVAILGSANLDVSKINLNSILLEGVAPIRSSCEDVATPNNCNAQTDDGYQDLVLKFDNQSIVGALVNAGEIYDGDTLPLTMTGELDGVPFEVTDNILIIKKGKK